MKNYIVVGNDKIATTKRAEYAYDTTDYRVIKQPSGLYLITCSGDLVRANMTDKEVAKFFDDFAEELEQIDIDDIINTGRFSFAVELMNDELRETVHRDLAPCTDEEFLREYYKRHFEKYGEPFTI